MATLVNLNRQQMLNMLVKLSEDSCEDWQAWLSAHVFVKMLPTGQALYLLAICDDEGPNPYESENAGWLIVTRVGTTMACEWANWE